MDFAEAVDPERALLELIKRSELPKRLGLPLFCQPQDRPKEVPSYQVFVHEKDMPFDQRGDWPRQFEVMYERMKRLHEILRPHLSGRP